MESELANLTQRLSEAETRIAMLENAARMSGNGKSDGGKLAHVVTFLSDKLGYRPAAETPSTPAQQS